jgi:hypothetical protein
MARRKSPRKVEPAVTSLFYEMPTSDVGVGRYIDVFSDLSRLNRKLIRQGYQLAVGGVTITDDVDVTTPLEVNISTAGNTWITHNAWTKGYSLWNQMNQEVIDDNPSVQGKWADFKVRLTENQATANTIFALNGASGAWPVGAEWQYSTFVVPQHDVNIVTGLVEPAEEWTACLVGPDDVPNKRFSLVKAYEESRATVQDRAPNVPVALPDSFYLKLTDDGSQDPELAAVIIDANDQPPYPMGPGEYPGSESFGFTGAMTRVARGVKNDFTPTMSLPGFTAECGLLYVTASRPVGLVSYANTRIQIHLVPGTYKGIMANKMGQ